MLALKYRLKSRVDFARIEIDGKLYQYRYFGFGVYNRNDNNLPRFGVVISTKISKKAVTRNRIKRIIHLVIQKNINKCTSGCDYVFLVKPSILPLNKDSLEKEVYEAITKDL